jgi:uncharacterized protein with HEPN domain
MSSGRRWKFRVKHILEALGKIQQYTNNMDLAQLTADSMALDAVIRNFQVIGEASRAIPEHVKRAHPEVPWSPMEKMRHVIVHDYDRVDVGIVWDTVKKDLPSPVPLLERLLEEEGE